MTKRSSDSETSPFRDAVDQDYHTMKLGEKGMPEYTDLGVGSNVMAISQLVRGGDPNKLAEEILATGNPQEIADLIVLLFVTRNTRGGKGEKDLAYKIFLRVWREFPLTGKDLLPLFAHYGYWKDYLHIILLCKVELVNDGLEEAALEVMRGQFLTDVATLDAYKNEIIAAGTDKEKLDLLRRKGPNISLLAKWLPRERSSIDDKIDFVNKFTEIVWPDAPSADATGMGQWQSNRKSKYRKTVAELTSFLELPEVLLSAQRADEINFHKLASVATRRLTKAFLNEDKQGNQRSDNPKRIRLAELFLDHVLSHGAKGSQLMPHEIVRKILRSQSISRSEEIVLDAQWKDLWKTVVESVEAQAKQEGLELNPTRMVPLSDVSGSMSGVPMEVAIALGIGISEITHKSFQNMVMTFESKPKWHRLNPKDSIVEKVQSLATADWGGSTDFLSAYRLILDVCKRHTLSREDMPTLIVFSDMQFDAAAGCAAPFGYGNDSQGSKSVQNDMKAIQDKINAEVHIVATSLGWNDFTPKPMVYWNLRSTGGHPVDKDTEGAVLLSGFSPSLLKFVMNGEALREEQVELVEADGTVVTAKLRVTPAEVLKRMLSDSQYDPVRAVLMASTEGRLTQFGPTTTKEAQVGESDDEFMMVGGSEEGDALEDHPMNQVG